MKSQQTLDKFIAQWIRDQCKACAAKHNPHMLEHWDDIVWEEEKK